MRQILCLYFFFVCGFSLVACSDQSVVNQPNTVSESKNVAAKQPIAVTQQEQQPEKSKAGGLLDFANKILEKAEEKSDEAGKAKDWMNEKFGDASESGMQIADDAAKWAADAFEKLKDKGMTTAATPAQWLKDDIRNMNALKYKIVKIELNDLEAVEEELNKLGGLRWDCFHVSEKDGQTVLFLKKVRRSLLKNIPMRDMMKLVPLMGSGE